MLVDEATQATESVTLVPLCRSARQLVLIGDQCQLPPVVRATGAAAEAGTPLFTRLVADGLPATMLSTQYRMHPAISAYPSDLFYAGCLADGVAAAERPSPGGFAWPRPGWPVALLPVRGAEQSDETSKLNRAEADAVASVVSQVISPRSPRDLPVISP